MTLTQHCRAWCGGSPRLDYYESLWTEQWITLIRAGRNYIPTLMLAVVYIVCRSCRCSNADVACSQLRKRKRAPTISESVPLCLNEMAR